VFSTPALEAAQDEYRRSCFAAHEAVREELKSLAGTLSPHIPQLVCAATFSLIASALDCHVRECKRRGWSLPSLKNFNVEHPSGLSLKEAWPYWLGGQADSSVIKNSFDMNVSSDMQTMSFLTDTTPNILFSLTK